MTRLLARARGVWNTLVHKDRLDRDLDDELRHAVETLTERHIEEGMDAAAARRAAIYAIGGRGGLAGARAAVRDDRIGAAADALLLDTRDAWRSLRSAPGLTAIVVLTLALGIGATTAIFSVVHAMLIKPLPYRDADRLAFIWLDRTSTAATTSGLGYPRGPMSGPDLRNLREDTRTFEAFGGIWATGSVVLAGDNGPEQLRSAGVTPNFFDVLGVQPIYGRAFRPEDSVDGAPLTVILGWDLFQRRFGGDPSLVGRQIQSADGTAATVIGILPKDFRLLLPPDAAVPDRLQAFIPFWPDLENGPRGNLFLRVVGRMRPGVTIEQARDDVSAMSRALTREIGSQRAFTLAVLQDDDVREIRGPLLALFAGVSILLMIACVNVASLLIARAASRTKETSVRLALGASRRRLVRQAAIEGGVLSLLAAPPACSWATCACSYCSPCCPNHSAGSRLRGSTSPCCCSRSAFQPCGGSSSRSPHVWSSSELNPLERVRSAQCGPRGWPHRGWRQPGVRVPRVSRHDRQPDGCVA